MYSPSIPIHFHLQSLFGATMLIVPSVATLIFLVAGSLQQDYIALAAIHLYTLLPGCLAVAIGFITHRINQRNFSDAYHKFVCVDCFLYLTLDMHCTSISYFILLLFVLYVFIRQRVRHSTDIRLSA